MSERQDIRLANGIILLSEYMNTGFHVCADHDIIYAGPDSYDDVEDHDAETLVTNGWFKDDESGRWAFYV